MEKSGRTIRLHTQTTHFCVNSSRGIIKTNNAVLVQSPALEDLHLKKEKQHLNQLTSLEANPVIM